MSALLCAVCALSSKRFALGTRASFALERFNKKLVNAVKPVACVEAFKSGEEPIEFGPVVPLMAMCEWDLRVVQEAPFELIRAGAKIPNGELSYLDDDGKLQWSDIHDLVREKRVVFFGVPGAFTPTCSYQRAHQRTFMYSNLSAYGIMRSHLE